MSTSSPPTQNIPSYWTLRYTDNYWCCRETARCFVSLNILLIDSRSLKVIRNDTIEYGLSPYWYLTETISVCRTVYEIFSVKEWHNLETGGRGRSRSLKMAPFNRWHTTFYWSAICKYSCMLYHFQVIWRWITVTLKMSLKIIQAATTWKLGCGFLFALHSNQSRIFNRLEIFNVKV